MRISDWSSDVCSSDLERDDMGLPLACKRGERSMKRLAIYCGSATPGDPRYIELAREVGRTLAERGIGVVYGGGRLGLMGAIADSALDAGGEVIGVIRSEEHTSELQSLMRISYAVFCLKK